MKTRITRLGCSVAVLTATALFTSGLWAAQPAKPMIMPPKPPPAASLPAPPVPSPETAQPSVQSAAPSALVVSQNPVATTTVPISTGSAAATSDTHRSYGSFMISRPRWGESLAPSQQLASATAAQVAAADPTLIVVPNNTLGPGPAYWETRERDAADRRYAEAQAIAAERDALAPRYDDNNYGVGFGGYYPRRGYIAHRGRGHRPAMAIDGLQFDDIGAPQQREFARNATPQIGASIDAQLQAQRDFTRSATPPVFEIQTQIDRAFLRGQKDLNSPRPALPTNPPPNNPRPRRRP